MSYATILSYGPSATDTDQIVTEVMTVGDPVRGFDEFINIDGSFKRFYADLQTGEIRISEEGIKSFVKEVWVRVYCTEDTGSPFMALQVRALDQDDWYSLNDSEGTISVTTSACAGTNTVFGNIIGYGDGSTVAFTTQVAASRCRVAVDDVVTTDFTVTGASQITLTTAPAIGSVISTYWSGKPQPTMKAGDFVETSEGLHRIVRIYDYNSLILNWYPTETLVGTHLPSLQLQSGEYEAVFPVNQTLNTLQVRIRIVPRDLISASDVVKIIGFNVVYVPGAMRHLKSER